MEEVVAEQLALTLDGSTLSQAEAALHELRKSPEFIQGIFGVCGNGAYPDVVRQQAIIYLRMMVAGVWNTELPPEVHAYIFETLPILVRHLPFTGLLTSYARSVIKAGFFENQEWGALPDTIGQLFAEGTPESVRAGLLLANALCGEIKHFLCDELTPFIAEFSEMLVVAVAQVVTLPSVSYDMLTLAFHCAYRLLWLDDKVPSFTMMTPPAFAIVEASMAVGNFANSEEYFGYAVKALKFIKLFIKNKGMHIGIDGLGSYMGLVHSLFVNPIPPKARCQLVEILMTILAFDCVPVSEVEAFDTWSFISGDILDFVRNIILPMFALTEAEIEMFMMDSVGFVSEIHKFDNDYNDIRVIARTFMKKYGHVEHEDLLEAVRFVACEAFDMYAEHPGEEQSIMLFNAFLMFSSVSTSQNERNWSIMHAFFRTIADVLQCEDHLARCAGFMLMAETVSHVRPDGPFPDLAAICVDHLASDPYPAIRYYSVIVIAQFLRLSEDQEEFRVQYQPVLEGIFTSIMQLCEEFCNDRDIGDAISNLVNVFNEDILPVAVDISQQTLLFLIGACESDDCERGMDMISTFENLVDLVMLNPAAREEFGHRIFINAVEALAAVTDCQLFNSFMLPLVHLIHKSSFVVECWGIAPIIVDRVTNDPGIALGDTLDILSELLVKDVEFAAREDLVTPLVEFTMFSLENRMEKPDEWNEVAKLAASLLIRLGADHPATVAMFERLSIMTIQQISIQNSSFMLGSKGLLIITNILMFINFPQFAAVAGDTIDPVLEFWLSMPMFPETVVSGLTVFDAFDSSPMVQMRIMYTITAMLCGDILTRSKADGDTFDQDAESNTPYIWFDFSETLMNFFGFLNNLREGRPDFFSTFMEQLTEDDEEVPQALEMLPTVAQWYAEDRDA